MTQARKTKDSRQTDLVEPSSSSIGQDVPELAVLFKVPRVVLPQAEVEKNEPTPQASSTARASKKQNQQVSQAPIEDQPSPVRDRSDASTVTHQVGTKNIPSTIPDATSPAKEESKVELAKKATPPSSRATFKSAQATGGAEKSAGGSWFDSQGKLITICFLVALTATIYFARSKRENEAAKNASLASSEQEELLHESTNEPATEIGNDEQANSATKPTAREIAIARRKAAQAARAAEEAAETPRADLLPPMDLSAPPLVKSSNNDDITPIGVAESNMPSAESPTTQTRVAALPDGSATTRSTSGGSFVPSVETAGQTPPANYPPLSSSTTSEGGSQGYGVPYPDTSSNGTNSYPSTGAAPYRYYLPPGESSAPTPPTNEPNYERPGPGLY